MDLIHKGKVRDVYTDNGDIILVASDRVSVYDVILPTPIPDKGAILTQLSLWWFRQLADVIPNHVINEDVPAEFAGRAVRCARVEILPVECIVRGYLAGLGLTSYQNTGQVSGITFPAGLGDGSQLPNPVFTPSTKAAQGEHDEHIDFDAVVTTLGADMADRLRDVSLELYSKGSQIAADAGVIIADTKFEFGLAADGTLTLADEILTPDSSRFWRKEDWQPHQRQQAFDKQYVRDWSSELDWDRTAPGPEVPDHVVAETHRRYVAIYERITGETWVS